MTTKIEGTEVIHEDRPTGLPRPLLDRATLERVHQYFEFEATSDHQFDRWLHEEILRATKGRDLTLEEIQVHLDF